MNHSEKNLSPTQPNTRILGTSMMLAASLCFSTGGLLMKIIPWNPLAINGARNLIACIVIGIYILATHHRLKFNRTVLVGAISMAGVTTLYSIANKLTTAGNTIILQYTAPIWIVILMFIIFGQKPSKTALVSILIVFAGILCFFFEGLSTGKWLGDLLALLSGIVSADAVYAQQTYEEMELLTVNEQVTTVITASEPIRFVDISTDKVAGDQPLSNTIRLKPKEGAHEDGECLAIVTIVTERYRTQYALLYTTRLQEAVADKEVQQTEKTAYHNPSVSLSTEEMYAIARQIWSSPAKWRDVKVKKHRMEMRLNNIYSVSDYFFIDFSINNKTNIRFDIDELRFKLADKKMSKATNAQIIELTPAMLLDSRQSFMHGYRNVVVIKKMTFPNDKVFSIELSEKQISGRTITLNIDYEDVLYADSFNKVLLQED